VAAFNERMTVRLLILMAMLLSTHALAATHPLLNDREGKSALLTSSQIRLIDRGNISPAVLERDVMDALGAIKGEACAFSLNSQLGTKLANHPGVGDNFDTFLRAIRQQGLIDDVVLQSLLRAYGVQKDLDRGARDDAQEVSNPDAETRALREFGLKRSRGKCLHENFRELLAALRQVNANYTTRMLEKKVTAAVRERSLSEKAGDEIKELIKDDADRWEISLADYVNKRQFLRNQFEVNASERSEFVTKKAPKSAVTYRQRLYALYTPIQITLMGDVIRKLKLRLESPKIEILVYDDGDEVEEVITLDPMERFRFAIRILRKEMQLLGANNYFAGRAPSYTDLMAAAYEAGIVAALELDQVALLEEIWNPKRTFWDKAQVWVRMFGSVLSVVVPPPYGFLPALAITAIEMVNREQPNDDTDSLF